MKKDFIAISEARINASLPKVWDALVNPEVIREYMFGAEVITDWKEGNEILWKGEWEGKPYEDKGKIIEVVPEKLLQYTHFSPLTGQPDIPENYHTVTVELSDEKPGVLVTLYQDNNASEKEKELSEKNWNMMLDALKKLLEG